MQIIASYSQAQKDIISKLQQAGLYKRERTCLLVIMSTNNYVRTDDDLATILSEYPGITSKSNLKREIHRCEKEGYLKKKIVDSGVKKTIYYLQDEDGFQKFLRELPPDIQESIKLCRMSYKKTECVTVLGLLSGGGKDGYINSSFHLHLKEAQHEILLPMLNTAPNDIVINVLKERAQSGVKIKILLPDYNKVVKKIRNAKEDTSKGWIQKLQGIKNIEIRIYHHIEDSSIYSSVVIDRKLCRICVFDSKKEKSSNGTLIEVEKSGYNLNLIDMMIDRFNDIWLRSHPINESKLIWALKEKNTWLCIFLFIAIVVFFKTDNLIHEVALNISMTILGILIGVLYDDGKKITTKLYQKLKKKGT